MTKQLVNHGHRVTPIVPALWTPVPDRHIPESVRHVQVDFQAQDYAEEGLYTLIKNTAYRAKYLRVIRHLAEQIIEAAEARPLFTPCEIGSLDLSRNAFHVSWENVAANRRLTIMVAASSVHQLPADRAEQPYGATPAGWRPFHADAAGPIAELVSSWARDLEYEPKVVPIDEGLGMDWSSPDTGLGVVLVDPWWCLDGSRTERIRTIDRLSQSRIGAAVIWNEDDHQTQQAMNELRKSLQAAAPRVLGDRGAPPAFGAVNVSNQDQFEAQFKSLLDRAFNRYLNLARARPPAGSPGSRPYLYGPGSGPPPTRTSADGRP
jgi:FxsC-like protein